MKPITLIFLSLLILKVISTTGQENLKIGHINSQEILQQLPVTDSIQKVLAGEANEMEQLYNEMLKVHEANIQKFESEKATYSEFVRNSKQKDLMEAETKIQQFSQDASQQLQKRQSELLKPVYEKINDAIEKVSLTNSFSYVLDLSVGAVAFYSPKSDNLTPLVLRELGVELH